MQWRKSSPNSYNHKHLGTSEFRLLENSNLVKQFQLELATPTKVYLNRVQSWPTERRVCQRVNESQICARTTQIKTNS